MACGVSDLTTVTEDGSPYVCEECQSDKIRTIRTNIKELKNERLRLTANYLKWMGCLIIAHINKTSSVNNIGHYSIQLKSAESSLLIAQAKEVMAHAELGRAFVIPALPTISELLEIKDE